MKKLYYVLETTNGVTPNIICESLENDVCKIINELLVGVKEDEEVEPPVFRISTIWLTEEEYNNLPEE
jgi:hypothetical protein